MRSLLLILGFTLAFWSLTLWALARAVVAFMGPTSRLSQPTMTAAAVGCLMAATVAIVALAGWAWQRLGPA